EQRRALDELVAGQREQPPLRRAPEPVPGPADALQERGDRPRRADLADEVDVADVDAELERGRRDDGLELPRLQALLGGQAVLLREAAVMRRHGVLAEPLREMPRRTLAEPAGVDEQQRRAMRADQVSELVVDLGP